MQRYEKIIASLDEQLSFIAQETQSIIKQAELCVPICVNALDQTKRLLKKHSFKTAKDEIYFFKHLKPKIASKLIYHLQRFNIEVGKPSGTSKQQKKYFLRQLKKITRYTEDNLDFFQYYRSDSTYLDEKYFLRGKADLHLILDSNFFNFDAEFNTSHDHAVAQIVAYDMIGLYIRTEISNLERQINQPKTENFGGKKLTWTENKIAAIELVYALHSIKCLNSGTAEISEIAATFEKAFNIELNDYYRKYIEIKSRKVQQTKFLDQLKESLNNRINSEME